MRFACALRTGPRSVRVRRTAAGIVGTLVIGWSTLAPAEPVDLGRLFFTPTQRAQLEAARAQTGNSIADGSAPAAGEAPAPLRYDGVVIRSDGRSTRWVDGRPQADAAGVAGLKPGQVRAQGKVYEPYEILQSPPAPPTQPAAKESAP